MNLKRFRKFQNLFSTIIFLLIFSFFYSTTNFKLTDIQLSYWGVNNKFSLLWNLSLAILSISFFLNFKHYVSSSPRLKLTKFTNILFYIVFTTLFLTAIVDMRFFIHNVFAYIYFFSYPLAIFLLAHFNSKNLSYSEWFTHLLFSITISIIPLSIIPFHKGFAYSEIAHSILIILWNVWLLKKAT